MLLSGTAKGNIQDTISDDQKVEILGHRHRNYDGFWSRKIKLPGFFAFWYLVGMSEELSVGCAIDFSDCFA